MKPQRRYMESCLLRIRCAEEHNKVDQLYRARSRTTTRLSTTIASLPPGIYLLELYTIINTTYRPRYTLHPNGRPYHQLLPLEIYKRPGLVQTTVPSKSVQNTNALYLSLPPNGTNRPTTRRTADINSLT